MSDVVVICELVLRRTVILIFGFRNPIALELSIAQLHWSTANYQPFQEGTFI